MGRELKRIALDWDFPIGKTWTGYLNPHYSERRQCLACDGDSYSLAGRMLNDLWYFTLYGERVPSEIVAGLAAKRPLPAGLLRFAARVVQSGKPWAHALEQQDVDALLAANRLWDFTRTPRTDEQREVVRTRIADGHNSWLPDGNGYRPSAEEVNEWSRHSFGHDSINAWICQRARAKLYGVGTSCPACRGRGHVPDAEVAKRIRRWKPTEPPAGPGYQIWQTVSEGGPVSPVFANPADLARWMVANDNSVTRGTTYEQWVDFITGPGWAPSMMSTTNGRIVSGVQAVTEIAKTGVAL